MESNLFLSGIKPAVNVGLSVSRVGGSAQRKTMRKVAGTLRIDLSQYQELAGFAQFGSELDKESQRQIERGKRMTELLKQNQYAPLKVGEEVLVLYAGTHGYLDTVQVTDVLAYEQQLLSYARTEGKKVLEEMNQAVELTEDLEKEVVGLLDHFKTVFKAGK